MQTCILLNDEHFELTDPDTKNSQQRFWIEKGNTFFRHVLQYNVKAFVLSQP